MFDLSRKSLKIKAKLGLAVTLLVLTSACAHETIPPQMEATERAIEPTPEPYAKAAPVTHSHKQHRVLARHGHKKYVTIAKNKFVAPKVLPTEIKAAAATVAVPVPPRALTMASITSDQSGDSESLWQKVSGSWIAWFALAYGIGLAAIASRKLRKKGKGRKLVFNN